MKREEISRLLQAHRDGDLALPAAERLVSALRAGGAERDLIMDEIRLGGLLGQAAEELDTETFVQTLLARLEGGSPESVACETSRARPAQRVLRWNWWLTGMAAAVLVGIGLLVRHQFQRVGDRLAGAAERLASIELSRGDVTVIGPTGERAALPGTAVLKGETILTGPEPSVAVLAVPSMMRLELGARTSVGLERDAVAPARRRKVFLTRGHLVADVASTGPNSVAFATPHAELQVLGTRFTVDVAGATRVAMQEGTLRVRNLQNGAIDTLTAGFAAVVTGAQTVIAPRSETPGAPPARPRAAGPLVRYAFGEGRGAIVHDTAGAGPAFDLTIADPAHVSWISGGGLSINEPTKIVSATPAQRLIETCRATDEVTVEVWVRPRRILPSSVTGYIGPARIVSLARGPRFANLILAGEYDVSGWGPCYVLRVRTTNSNPDAKFAAIASGPLVRDALTHVVFTRSRFGESHLYVNGQNATAGSVLYRGKPLEFVPTVPRSGGSLQNWGGDCLLALANEVTGGRPWLGELYFVAVYGRALSAAEVAKRYVAGRPRAEIGRP